MLVEQIWTNSPLRNFNYLIACSQTGEALALDPLNADLVLSRAREKGWSITQIINSHEHFDHIAGNRALQHATGAPVSSHPGARDAIPEMSQALEPGEVVRVGNTVELEVVDTPGHTMSHLSLRSHGDEPAIFCGDTLFNSGVGNCRNGGDPVVLYTTVAEQFSKLSDSTRIFPGHDYIESNLRFTLDREPDNEDAKEWLNLISEHNPEQAAITTMGNERKTNAFLRLQSPTLIERLREAFSELPAEPAPRDVFVKLRALRDKW